MVNMTPDFYNFFRNTLEILGLKSWGLLTLCVFTVDVASVGRFPIDRYFLLTEKKELVLGKVLVLGF